jgi:hypothetical protein
MLKTSFYCVFLNNYFWRQESPRSPSPETPKEPTATAVAATPDATEAAQ